ncbi:TetR family transcriptional regulator [Novosphingobium sediminis]|uniref:TetR family transcriptional regulator n=1 Tax=Novosphingobium sediminis TaxID=707214 RepID=A0A512AJD1_9SPHN|nr:TetR/AcrR family transcriptional regulator [Novosphingobium sediminis]GEN99815.1 TetR family transcriptional regulator [Novosphingobium sediminis]
MRQSREAKAVTHQAIVAAAARQFRERGIEGTSVGDVMRAANRTHGGFYRHFDSKEDLLVAALGRAFAEMLEVVDRGLSEVPAEQALGSFMRSYTAPERVEDVAGSCPVAALSNDVLRSTEVVQAEFGRGVRAMIRSLAEHLDGPEAEREARAARTFAMAAGAVMIARASDPETAERVLRAVRDEAASLASPPSRTMA